ncbi:MULTISPECIES: FxsA family protein [unclassified Nocardiopsis]|uniref:FxsA family protein n=1 Tax=Nocardiopsis TaxID=2013 RepID=UPI00387AE18E
MPILIVLALMALPFVEVWLMIVVGGWIGVPWTLASLVALMVLGVAVLRRAGTKAFRDADEALRSGQQPRGGLLDPLMLMAGGILLVIPGYLTAAVGLLLVLPFTRPLLRWAFTGWAQRRMRRMQDRMEAELLAQGVRVPGQNPFGPGQSPFEPGQSPFGGAGADRGQERPATSRGRVIQGHFEPDDTEQGRN